MAQPPKKKWSDLDWTGSAQPHDRPPDSAPPSGTGVPAVGHPSTFPYQPRAAALLLGVLFFGFCGVSMVHEAQTNNRGLIIEGIFRLEKEGATIFYWVGAGACFAFVGMGVFFVLPQFFIRRQITIDDVSITVPGWGFSTKHYRIEFRDITNISVSTYRKHIFLKIRHIGGKASINSGMLPRNEDMHVIVNRIADRLRLLKDPAAVCANCGYSLRGNVSGRCPECGQISWSARR